MRAVEVARPHARREPVARAVGQLERVRVVAERDHRGHGPEDLLLTETQVGVRGAHQCGFHVVAARERRAVGEQLRTGAPTEQQLRSFGGSEREVRTHPFELLGGDERSHRRGVVERRARLHVGGLSGDALHHVVEDRLVQQDARSRDARLARIAGEHRHRGDAVCSRIEIGIGEHDVGRLAPELEVQRLERRRRALRDDARRCRVEPVKLIRPTRGSRTSASPASSPSPATTFTTPVGSPDSSSSSPSRSNEHDACSAGFITTVLPAASAAPSLAIAIESGAFHGTIRPTTPIGSRTVKLKLVGPICTVSPLILSAAPAK